MLTAITEIWWSAGWRNNLKDTFTYDNSGNLLTELMQSWINDTWANQWVYTYTYDTDGNMLTFRSEKWENNTWINFDFRTYTYDTFGNSLTGEYETWLNGSWQPGIGYFLDIWSQKNRIYTVRDLYRYEAHFISFVTGTENIKRANALFVYPNPSSGRIILDTKDIGHLSIFNLNGQSLLQQEITGPTITIDVSDLPSAVYMVKIVGENGALVGKIIKK
jgi:hypothetical protein